MDPSIVILMVTYNRRLYTVKALASLLRQTHQDFKLIIIDNGSSDGTVEMIRELTDPRIEFIPLGENKGLSYATNLAFQKYPQATYLGKVDNDVILPENWLERCIKAHQACRQFGFIGGFHFFPYHIAEITPKITEHEGIKIWEKPYIGGCSFLIKNTDYSNFGPIGTGKEYEKIMGLTDYQTAWSQAGKINGYLWEPPIWVEHMEHRNSAHNIDTPEYNDYKMGVRGVSVADYSSTFDRDSQFYLRINTCDQR